MINDISESFFLYGIAHEIWKTIKEFYSSRENTSEILQSNLASMTCNKKTNL